MTRDRDRVMLDIETLGVEPGAAILSVGAVRFGAGALGETFERSVSLKSCQAAGLEIDADTLDWWLQQDDDVAQAALNGGEDLEEVLAAFTEWYRGTDEIWANSPSFDCRILEHAYNAVGFAAPWEYYEERDYRTLAALPVAPDLEHDGVQHDALDDAKHQAQVAAETLELLENAEPEIRTDGGSVQGDDPERGNPSQNGTARYSDPLGREGTSVGRGAVLYDRRDSDNRTCCGRHGCRHLYHVMGVYEETTDGTVYFDVQDGTHTVQEWVHQDDLLALFDPAGWSINPGWKPTYVLTREHGVEDHHDLMTDGGEDVDGSTLEKGNRHENEAKSILKHVYGAGVEKVDAWGHSDPFGFVDLVAMQPGDPVKFVQVKTNRFTAEDRRKYRRRTRKLPPEHAEFEVWVRHDRQGWELHSYDPEAREFDHFWSIDVCDSSEAGQRYRRFMKEQQELVTDGSGRETPERSITGTDRATCDRCGEPIQGKMYVLDAIEHPRTGAVGDCCWKPGDEVVLL